VLGSGSGSYFQGQDKAKTKTRQGQERAECAMSRACITGSREGMGSLV
jgi:hypothetical protein